MHISTGLMTIGIKALLITGLLLALALNLLLVYPALDNLLDFGSFVAAGRAARQGNNPYQSDLPLVFQLDIPNLGTVYSPNLNPPATLLLFETIAPANPLYSVTLWRIVTLLLYGCAILSLVRMYPFSNTLVRIAWALNFAGLWHIVQLGQIYVPLLLAAIGAWFSLEKAHLKIAGISLGFLIAIKPNFVLWALLLGIAGYWSIVAIAGIISLIISIIPIFVYGPQIYHQWFAAISEYQTKGIVLPGNNSLLSLMTRFNLGEFALVISLFLIGAAAFLVYQNRTDQQRINALGILISLLASPLAWTGYTILFLPLFFARKRWPWQYWIASIIFVFPYFMVLAFYETEFWKYVFFGWFYGWGLLFILLELFGGLHKKDASEFQIEQLGEARP